MYFERPQGGSEMPNMFTTDSFVFVPDPERTLEDNLKVMFDHLKQALNNDKIKEWCLRAEFNSTHEFQQDVEMISSLVTNIGEQYQENIDNEFVPYGVNDEGQTTYVRRVDKVKNENSNS